MIPSVYVFSNLAIIFVYACIQFSNPICKAQSVESTLGTTAVPQTFTESPEDVTVKEKGIAIFPCAIKNKVGKVRWTKDDFGLGEERNLTGFDRYTIIGDAEDGNYTLQIDPVLLEDEAKDGFQST